MTSDRIKEIQETTVYPNSVSVQQALLQVWNECEQEQKRQAAITIIGHFKSCNCAAPKPIGLFDAQPDNVLRYQCSQCLGIYQGVSHCHNHE